MVGVTGENPIANRFVTPFGSLAILYIAIELLVIFKLCLVSVSFVDDGNHDGNPPYLDVPSISITRYTYRCEPVFQESKIRFLVLGCSAFL
jgi:hypothetical protein